MDGLRLALIIFGIVVVAVVYFWTSRRRRFDREAGDFDRFDAWTDERLDPLAPSATNHSAGSSAGDADERVADADELPQPHSRAPAVRQASKSASDTVSQPAPAQAPAPGAVFRADAGQGAGTAGHGRDFWPDQPSDRSAPASRNDGALAQAAQAAAQHGAAAADAPMSQAAASTDAEVIEDLETIADSLDLRAEPRIGPLDGIELGESRSKPTIGASALDSASYSAAPPAASQAAVGAHQHGADESDESQDSGEMIVVLNVLARNGQTFAGPMLKAALEGAGLRPGDMKLYHYRAETQADDKPPIFSALNAIKPGTLAVGEFDDMRTPGIALILRVPGLERPSECFELMLVAARRMAGELSGQVCDQTRSTLTGQSLNHLREQIAAAALRARTGG